MTYRLALLGIALVSVLGFAACSDDDPVEPASLAGTYKSAPVALGGGSAYGWEELDNAGNLVALGVSFNESALNGLPATNTMLDIALPGKSSKSPFTHISLDWNPQGHEPPGVYDLPHFDVHFYIISEAEQAQIMAGPDTIPVDAQYVPAGYFSTMASVPMMGTHWLDQNAPELGGATFTKTFIYGFYQGEMVFLEPMITKAYFELQMDAVTDIAQPQAFQNNGKYYPQRYRVKYNASSKEYSVILEGMRMM